VAWGSLVQRQEEDANPSETKTTPTPSLTQRMKSTLQRSQSEDLHHQEAVEDLITELHLVRKEASDEFRQFVQYDKLSSFAANLPSPASLSSSGTEAAILLKRKRLLYLFVKDLSSGVSEEVLTNKSERRDAISRSSKVNCVPLKWKICGWILLALLDFGMLFYVYLFAIQQTHSRQLAWFQSFVMWILFEFFVASTCLVVVVHLLIPLSALTDLKKIKRKVLSDLTIFHEKYLQSRQHQHHVPAVAPGTGSLSSDAPPPSVTVIAPGVMSAQTTERSFNAAKYLYPSWRLASWCRDLPESGVILQFQTQWPKKKFGMKEAEIASEYEEDIIFNAVQQILLYFLTSLLHFPLCLQDIVIQMICNSGFGYLGILLLRLAHIHPLLPLAPLTFFLLCVHFLLKSGHEKFPRKFQEVAPLDSSSSHEKAQGQKQEGAVSEAHCSPSEGEQEEEYFDWNFEEESHPGELNESQAAENPSLAPPPAAAPAPAEQSEDEMIFWIAADSVDSSEISIFEPPLHGSSHSSRPPSPELDCDMKSFFQFD
jgi:hypothetical protein